MASYYNEIDPYAAQWLRNLIAENLIAPGDVDERSIADVQPSDLAGYVQCHFFAGIGGWSLALRLAGWADDRPVWTGSCPCQPFSAAGSRKGTADARHLWPQFERLIRQCSPSIVFGEQVTSTDGREWLAGVRADLEALDYAVGAADLCAAGVASPHARQRLYWVADTDGRHAGTEGLQRGREHGQRAQDHQDFEGMGNAESEPLRRSRQPWEPSITIECDDGYRRVGPTTLAMAHGIPNRMGRLRGYGNAIVPQVAAEVIGAYLEARAA
ncbi:DNA cytosine methyltransferase [Mesorhizobium caraganae]|uniref:DNA cytosine methyltransferase n=1 Tax=Mesorhizobium caraganae TaxID=483206 RepID=UPI0017869937|nr:DNA cytosine methyltransferase [Mesorhizobium caraganae]